MRGTLLDQARLAVADAEMCFREERSGLCPFVGCVGLLPELLRCDEVRYGLFSCLGRESDCIDRVLAQMTPVANGPSTPPRALAMASSSRRIPAATSPICVNARPSNAHPSASKSALP